MTDISCWLRRSRGQAECSASAFITSHLGAESPLLLWVDPDPLAVDYRGPTGRRLLALPLVEGNAPDWMLNVPLTEARIFWKQSALHVIADEAGGCRWARIEEATEGDKNGNGDSARVQREVIPVLTLSDRDRARFGITDRHSIENLQAVLYKRQGLLKAWRLLTKSWGHNDG